MRPAVLEQADRPRARCAGTLGGHTKRKVWKVLAPTRERRGSPGWSRLRTQERRRCTMRYVGEPARTRPAQIEKQLWSFHFTNQLVSRQRQPRGRAAHLSSQDDWSTRLWQAGPGPWASPRMAACTHAVGHRPCGRRPLWPPLSITATGPGSARSQMVLSRQREVARTEGDAGKPS